MAGPYASGDVGSIRVRRDWDVIGAVAIMAAKIMAWVPEIEAGRAQVVVSESE
jgi:hypothetical protein